MTTEQFVKLPPLENGDRLTRAEFKQRYNAMPHLKKAELIEGVVYVSSPARVMHSQPHADLMTWLGVYRAATPGVACYDNPTVRLDADNEPLPGLCLARDRRLARDRAAVLSTLQAGIASPAHLTFVTQLRSAFS
ncbi:Uma2 family endonuclease [Trichothermofontia sp.]